MKRKSKWVFWGFLSLDYKAVQTYLEDMASKGWMLEKINRSFAKFKAVEPRPLRFCVDVFKLGGPLTPENTEEAQSYRKLCEESGWHFITSLDYLQFFYADTVEPITPIQTDDAIEQKIVESTLWKNELIGLLIFMLIAGLTTGLHIPIDYKNLLTYIGVFGTYLFPVLFIAVMLSSAYHLTWIFKARRSIKRGYLLKVPSLKSAKLRAIAINTPLMIGLGLFIIAVFLDAMLKPMFVLRAMFPAILGLCVGLILRHMVKKKATEKKDSVLYVTLSLLIILGVSAITSNLSISDSENYDKIDLIPSNYPSIDFGLIAENSERIRTSFNPGRSPVVPMHYDYWENRVLNGEEVQLGVVYYQASSIGIAEIIFKGIIDELERGIKWRGAYYLSKEMDSDEALKAFWGVDNLSVSKARDELVVQNGRTVVRLYGDLDFENPQIRRLVIMGLFDE